MLHRNTCTLYGRFSGKHFLVGYDMVGPIHCYKYTEWTFLMKESRFPFKSPKHKVLYGIEGRTMVLDEGEDGYEIFGK